jgi:hypothetical protein
MEINTTDGRSADPVAVAIRSLHTMATGGRSDFDAVFHPDAVNRENKVQPPSSRVPGPAGFHSNALWLRAAFAGLHYKIHHALTDGDLVAVNSTMNGRHGAQFVLYPGRHGTRRTRMVSKYRIIDTGEVISKTELRRRLTAELDAMNPETRAANCDGTVDDLITDSVLVGTVERVHDEDE